MNTKRWITMSSINNPVPSIDTALKELKGTVRCITSDFGKEGYGQMQKRNVWKAIEILENVIQNGVETDNEQPNECDYLVMHSNYPTGFCSEDEKGDMEAYDSEKEFLTFIPIKHGEIG
jgi:hypothetical protein